MITPELLLYFKLLSYNKHHMMEMKHVCNTRGLFTIVLRAVLCIKKRSIRYQIHIAYYSLKIKYTTRLGYYFVRVT